MVDLPAGFDYVSEVKYVTGCNNLDYEVVVWTADLI